jgi:hypothetical protein
VLVCVVWGGNQRGVAAELGLRGVVSTEQLFEETEPLLSARSVAISTLLRVARTPFTWWVVWGGAMAVRALMGVHASRIELAGGCAWGRWRFLCAQVGKCAAAARCCDIAACISHGTPLFWLLPYAYLLQPFLLLSAAAIHYNPMHVYVGRCAAVAGCEAASAGAPLQLWGKSGHCNQH